MFQNSTLQILVRFTASFVSLMFLVFGCTQPQISEKAEEVLTKEVVMEHPRDTPAIKSSPAVSNSKVTPLKPTKIETVPQSETPHSNKNTVIRTQEAVQKKGVVQKKEKWTKEEVEKFSFYRLATNSSGMKGDFSAKGSLEFINVNEDNSDLSVLLFNKEGKLLKKAKVKPDNTFEFAALPTGDYSMALSSKASNVKADIKLVDIEDGDLLIKSEKAKEVPVEKPVKQVSVGEKLSPAEIEELFLKIGKVKEREKGMTGMLEAASKKVPINNVQLYVVNDKGVVVAETKSDTKGNFDFSELPEGKYSLIQGDKNPAITASMSKVNEDDSGLIVPFNPGRVLSTAEIIALPSAKIESGSFPAENNDVKGKVFRNQVMRQSVGQSVWLVDDNGKLITSATPDKDGVFVFRNLKAQQYTVVVENANNNSAFVDIISPEQSYQQEFTARDDSNLVVLLSKPIVLNDSKSHLQTVKDERQTSVREANRSYDEGLQKMKQNDFDGAKKDFQAAIDLSPDFVDAYIAHGKACELTKNYDEALIDYNNVLEFRPKHLSALYRRAYVENEKGDYENAIKDFSTVIELYPDYSYPYFYRAVAENQTGDHLGALKDYQKMITIDSTVQEAYFNEGSTYFQLNQYSKALEAYNRALLLDSTDADVYYNRGQVLQIQGFYEEAINDFNKAILNGPVKNAYYEKANTYAMIPNDELAIQCYNDAVAAYPKDGEAYLHRGVYYYNAGNIDEALVDFNKSIELNGKMGEYYFKRGVVLVKAKRLDEACSDFNTAVNLNYHDPEEQFFKKKYCKNVK